MSKLELAGTSGGYNIATINENFQKIEDTLNDLVLYRDNPSGESNVMNNHLDMNGFLILNTPSLGGGGDGPGDGTGGDGTDGYSTAIIYAYKRSATFPTETPGAIVYEFSSHNIITPTGPTLGGGWSKGIPEGDDPLYVSIVTASSLNATDSIGSNEWSGAVVLAKDGLDALNNAPLFIYQRTPTNGPPALPSQPCTYTFGVGSLVGLNNGWTTTIPASFNGKYLWVATASAISLTNSDVISNSEWSSASLLAQDGLDGLNGGANGLNNATFYAYKRSPSVPTNNPGDVTYHFASASITTPAGNFLGYEWQKSIPAGTDQLYVCVASASASTVTDTILANEWSAPSALGSNGLSTATLYVYQRTNSLTPPSAPLNPVTYDFGSKMITGLTNNWSAAIPAASGGKYLWVITATAASGSSTDSIPSSEWAAAQILAQDGTNGTNGTNGTSGSNGQRGTATIAYAISGSSWTTSDAQSALISAGYYPPINRDIVTLYNTGNNFSETRFYDSGSWVALTSYVNGNMLVSGTLSANKISGGILDGVQVRFGVGHTPSGKTFEITSAGTTWVDNLFGGSAWFDNVYSPNSDALQSFSQGNSAAIRGTVGSGNTSSTGHGVVGVNNNKGTAGIVGAANNYDFYASGSGTNYGPFTGAHDALLKLTDSPAVGDIVVDVQCVARSTLSNTIFLVETSSHASQKAAVGVFVQSRVLVDEDYPAAFIADRLPDGTLQVSPEYSPCIGKYKVAAVNALGEGQINVCGENGDIEAGDFIVTSNVAGKGMKQDDDILRNTTVARAREGVKFTSPGQIKQIACIYLCG